MSDGEPVVLAGPWFSRVLASVIALMFICLAVWIALAVAIAHPTDSQGALIEGLSHAFSGCLGALLGLLGGKLA
jgi:hypothetical protein